MRRARAFTRGGPCLAVVLAFAAGCRGVDPVEPPPGRPLFIAHAGGAAAGVPYSNSREALDESYRRGHRGFEIDFTWTIDGQIVLLHDWVDKFEDLFPGEAPGTRSLAEFRALSMRGGMSQMDLSELCVWLRQHPDADVVTDVKGRNSMGIGIGVIVKTCSNVRERFIAQVHDVAGYESARKLGFERVILTLYAGRMEDREVLEFASRHPVFAITLPSAHARKSTLARKLADQGVFVYAHTINDLDAWQELRSHGVHGIYTDNLAPSDLAPSGPAPTP